MEGSGIVSVNEFNMAPCKMSGKKPPVNFAIVRFRVASSVYNSSQSVYLS